jgi:hypothetical protein
MDRARPRVCLPNWRREPTPAPAPRASVVGWSGGRARRRFRLCHSCCTGLAEALVQVPGAARPPGVGVAAE